MRDRQRKLFEEIASEAVKDDVAGDYRWFYKNAKHIERELGPLLNKRERTSFAELKPAIAVIDQDSATLDNLQVGTHLSLESGLIVRSGQVAEAMGQKFHRVKGILHKPLSCQDGMPCNTIAMIGRLSAYYGNRVKRRIEDLKSINLEHRDDPLRYEPYAQWVEHRVMGLSKKILVEAKLIPSGNDARLKMTTLFDQSACQNEIMVGGVSIAHQTNFICLKSILSLERPETISPGATPSHIADQFERYKKLYELQTKYKHKIDFM